MGSAHAYLTMCQRPESIVHEHMADREDRVPSVTLDLDDMRLRYDAVSPLSWIQIHCRYSVSASLPDTKNTYLSSRVNIFYVLRQVATPAAARVP